jgi:hypothetical protein
MLYSFKCLQQEYPLKCTTIVFFALIAFFGYGFRVSEGNLVMVNAPFGITLKSNGFDAYWNCYWYTFITMASIGYGDYVPVAPLSRMLAVLLAIIGVTLNSFLVVALSQYLKMKAN